MKKIILLSWAALACVLGAAELNLIPNGLMPAPMSGGKKTSQPSARPEPPPFESPEVMQAEFVRRFEASPGFGMMRVIRPIFMAPSPALHFSGTQYQVAPPDLIGLENEQVVYAAREHSFLRAKTNSNVSELFRARPLTDLETNAVAALRKGRELFVKTIPPGPAAVQSKTIAPDLLVVGALRASESCAKCHGCEKGTLLGAFTYTLKPNPSSSNAVAGLKIPLDPPVTEPVVESSDLAVLFGCSGLTP